LSFFFSEKIIFNRKSIYYYFLDVCLNFVKEAEVKNKVVQNLFLKSRRHV